MFIKNATDSGLILKLNKFNNILFIRYNLYYTYTDFALITKNNLYFPGFNKYLNYKNLETKNLKAFLPKRLNKIFIYKDFYKVLAGNAKTNLPIINNQLFYQTVFGDI